MIYGIGTDIVEVVRIEQSLAKFGEAFAQRILNVSEWQEYEQSRVKARFLAKRFAAKEAFAKALGTGIRGPATFENIGISHDELGKPILVLAAELQALLDAQGIVGQHLSISDEKALAAAFVVLEKA
ncbi:holo-ACP synthase [Methylobacillus caricis]|uniref:holo-ACP synthase n=1 Tax=Methylobacillus caricis TaxID=1971611 RepID=UPI001CFF81A5|nr:holo-ACP synthase [Methylobacillus caricis]MCB5186991.1 holo-ACP synthase [Methylobacillus caricis]